MWEVFRTNVRSFDAIEMDLRSLVIGSYVAQQKILGLLDDYGTRSGFIITPVVVWGGGDCALAPNPDEVASVHRVPLRELDKPDVPKLISIPESDRPVIQLPLLGTLIHAPTAAGDCHIFSNGSLARR